jgi:hypothetical protein
MTTGLISPSSPPPSPDPLACDLLLASAVVSAARRDSRQSALQPTKEDLRLCPPHRRPPALPHIYGTPARRLSPRIRPSFRHASKGRFEAGLHLPKRTKGQRLDAPNLLEPSLPQPLAVDHAKGVAAQLCCLLCHQVDGAQLLLGTPVENPVLRAPPL